MALCSELVKLIETPLKMYDDISTTLSLTNYEKLFQFFGYESRHSLAVSVARSIVEKRLALKTLPVVGCHLRSTARWKSRPSEYSLGSRPKGSS